MEKEIESRVKGITKRSAKILEENSGVEAPIENEDIEKYIRLVVKEKEKLLKGYDHDKDGVSVDSNFSRKMFAAIDLNPFFE